MTESRVPRLAPRPLAAVSAGHVLAALAAGAVLRLALLRLPHLWFDEATVGVMGLAVLRGELPVYFFGQPFMGALDAYLAAPLYVTLGVSAGTLKLVPLLLGLTWMGLVVRVAWEAFGPRAALFAAIVLAVPPDYVLAWCLDVRPQYPLTVVLGTLAILLARRAPAPRRAPLHFALLGFVLGLAFWTNFLSLVYVPPVAALSLMRDRPSRLVPGGLTAVPAFALGSLPHWLYGLQHGTALPPPGSPIGLSGILAHASTLWQLAWPILSGVPADLRGTIPGTLLALGLTALYLWALVVALLRWRDRGPAGRAMLVALLGLVVVDVGLAVGTEYGRFLWDPRYLLPLYTALPPLLGSALAGLVAWRAAAALVGALLLVHAAGELTGEFRRLAPAAAPLLGDELQAQRDTLAAIERDGPRRFYAPDAGPLRVFTFLSRERVIFSNHYEEPIPRYALAVDGADAVGWWMSDRSAALEASFDTLGVRFGYAWRGGRSPLLEANLAALGVRFAYRRYGPFGGAYVDFALSPGTVRELDPARFAVAASEGSAAAGWAVDRDAATVWRTARPMRGGEWIQVDLGATEPVALVRWLPGAYQETPRGLTFETSLDGAVWRRLIVLPSYLGPLYWSAGRPMGRVRSGRVELRLPATPARYLRITQTGRQTWWHWTIRELFVYAVASGPAADAGAPDDARLARALRAAGVTRLYADHGWGSRVALADPGIRVPPANRALDVYGFVGSMTELWPTVRWGPGSAVLLEPVDAPGFAAAARTGGLGFGREPLAGLVLFTYAPAPARPGVALPAASLRVTASLEPARGALAVDGDAGTRWATARPQTAGDWVRVDLEGPRPVRAVRLWTAHPTDSPRGLALEGSEDGATWRPIPATLRTEGRHRWGGIALLRDGSDAVRLDFSPQTLRALRLVLTRGDPVYDWSIHELTVHTAE